MQLHSLSPYIYRAEPTRAHLFFFWKSKGKPPPVFSLVSILYGDFRRQMCVTYGWNPPFSHVCSYTIAAAAISDTRSSFSSACCSSELSLFSSVLSYRHQDRAHCKLCLITEIDIYPRERPKNILRCLIIEMLQKTA